MSDLTRIRKRFSKPGLVPKLRAAGDILRYAIPGAALLAIALNGNADFARYWIVVIAVTHVLTELMKKAMNNTPLGKRPDAKRIVCQVVTHQAHLVEHGFSILYTGRLSQLFHYFSLPLLRLVEFSLNDIIGMM